MAKVTIVKEPSTTISRRDRGEGWRAVVPHTIMLLTAAFVAVNRFVEVVLEAKDGLVGCPIQIRGLDALKSRSKKKLIKEWIRGWCVTGSYRIRVRGAKDLSRNVGVLTVLIGIGKVLQKVAPSNAELMWQKLGDIAIEMKIFGYDAAIEAMLEGDDIFFVVQPDATRQYHDFSGIDNQYQMVFMRTNLHRKGFRPRDVDTDTVEHRHVTLALATAVEAEANPNEKKACGKRRWLKEDKMETCLHDYEEDLFPENPTRMEKNCRDAITGLLSENKYKQVLAGYEIQKGGVLLFLKKSMHRKHEEYLKRISDALVAVCGTKLKETHFDFIEMTSGAYVESIPVSGPTGSSSN